MSVFNPIASMQRLEAAGFKRAQAEALADELRDATSDLVTNEQLTRALDAQTAKLTLWIEGLEGKLTQRIDGLEGKLTKRIDGLEVQLTQRIDGLEGKLTQRMDGLEGKLTLRADALENKLTLRICGILGGLLTLGFAAVGLAIAFS